MDDERTEIDHMSVTVWRVGVGWWYTISARDENGVQLSLESGEVRGTPRPLSGTRPGDDARVVLYACAVDQAAEHPSR